MSAVDDLLGSLPIDALAAQVGASPEEVRAAAQSVVPALLGGLQANAQEPAGAASIAEALGQHAGPVDVASIDPADGAKIASHVFGDSHDQVVQQLGGLGGSSSGLVKKLLPLLAPIVLSYLAGRAGKSGVGGAATGGVVGTILEEVLKGASQGSATPAPSTGSIISDVLGGLLGRGRR